MKKMMTMILSVLIAGAVTFGVTGQSPAALVGGPDIIAAPAFILDDPPGAVNDHQQAFNEQQCVLLVLDTFVDDGFIPGGTLVNSHMIFLNTEGTTPGLDENVTWVFDGLVLGVMSDMGGSLEAASSLFLGAPGTIYPAAFPNRGMELADGYVVAGNSIAVSMGVSEPGDWIRVVTAAHPGCDTVKWRQPPDINWGVNVRSIEPEPLVADDWQCTDPRPVTDVHFWGSFIGWERAKPNPTEPPPVVDGFWIRIYRDVPAGVDPKFPFSHPGELLFSVFVKDFMQELVASSPRPDETYEHKFYYSLDLPEPFNQEEGRIYWISIAAVMVENSEYPWGWETSNMHWNDNAARFWFFNNYWEEIVPSMLPPWYQEKHQWVDMAFELTVEPEPPPEPPPPLELVKWQQRPDMRHGINVPSTPPDTDPNGQSNVTVADDWLCLDGSPVSDLHFWGSYLHWFDTVPLPMGPPPGVERFRIQIYSDAPATAAGGFSHPDKLLYEVWVDTFSETYVESFPVTWPPGAEFEHKFRYDLELPRIFWQKRDRIYWLNIAAIPRDPEFTWGWESAMDRWNDYALTGWYNDPDDSFWDLIKNPMIDQYVDMSFELTTCGGPIKWLQFPDMAEGVNIVSVLENRVVADDWLCTNGEPITEVHFWGSYLSPNDEVHWEQNNPGPPLNPLPSTPGVQGFKLSFHADIPAGVDAEMPWSHPGELIQELGIDFDLIRERYWDSVPHTNAAGEVWWEHKFYYVAKLEKPFLQEEGTIYWLDVAALPRPGSNWMWGWETSKDHWNDNAVRGDGMKWEAMGRPRSAFEDLPLGASYVVGDTFVTSGIPITVGEFQWSNGSWTDAGNTTVVNSGMAGGAGKELNVNNVNLHFGFDYPLDHIVLLFGEYGGNLNIRINGVFKNFDNFVQIDGQSIGGVDIAVTNGLGNDKGSLRLKGEIWEFALGGQELFIDNVEGKRKLDMAFLLITPDNIDYCEGDFDRDGDVDEADLDVFAADFGRDDCFYTGDCEGDFDYDGDQDGRDLSVLAEDYGRKDCPCVAPQPCNDGNPCTIDFIDPDGQCRHRVKDCEDGNPCTQDSCDPDTGRCLHEPICGACCLPDATCKEIPPGECRELGGVPEPVGTRCRDTDCLATIGDFAWEDLNRNGIQDAGEPGLENVVVELFTCGTNTPIATTTTHGGGKYFFSMMPGDYYLKFLLQPGFLFSPQDQGSDDAKDSDPDPGTGKTVCTTVIPGQNDMTWDAGMFKAQPGIDIEKSTNGEDADAPPGPSIPVGEPVKWEYVVKNTGDVPLTNVSLTDIQNGVMHTFPGPFAPAESRSLSIEGTATEGQYSNLGTATGTAPDGTIVSDEDLSHYLGIVRPQACCLPKGGCEETTPDVCVKQLGGIPQGPGTDCSTAQCPFAEACCYPDGSCDDWVRVHCAQDGGTPQGPGTDCSSTKCLPTLACCLPNGTCADLTKEECESAQGVPHQEGSNCQTVECPPTVACCLPDVGCVNHPQEICLQKGGDPVQGTDCSNNPCGKP